MSHTLAALTIQWSAVIIAVIGLPISIVVIGIIMRRRLSAMLTKAHK